jgi:threonine/homoserine/homoserine lactone efflux protein
MLWIFAYFTYIRNPESDTPDLYCTFIFVLGWIGVAFFFFYAFFSRRFRSVVRKNKVGHKHAGQTKHF